MRNFLVLLILLAMASTQGCPCCFPDQFEAQLMMISSNFLYPIEEHLAVNVTGKQLRIDSLPPDNITFLVLYNTNSSYLIYWNERKCLHLWAPEPSFPACVPKDAIVTDRYTVGYHPSINVTNYTWKALNEYVTLAFTNNCIPFGAQTLAKDFSDDIVTYYLVKNLTMGIKNPHEFDVPDFCKSSRPPLKLHILSGSSGDRNHVTKGTCSECFQIKPFVWDLFTM